MARTGRKRNRIGLKLLALFILIVAAVAAIRLWGSIRLAGTLNDLRRQGYVLRPAGFNAPEVESHRNAATLVLAACEWARDHPAEMAVLAGAQPLTADRLDHWTAAEIAKARDAAAAFQPAIDLAVMAAGRPESRFPLDYAAQEPLPDLAGAGPVFRACLLEAKWRLTRGESGAAIDNLHAAASFLAAIGREPAYAYRLLVVRLFPELFIALEDACSEVRITATDLNSLHSVLDALAGCRLHESLTLELALLAESWRSGAVRSRDPFAWPSLPWDVRYALNRRVRYLEILALPGAERSAAVLELRGERFPDWTVNAPGMLVDAELRYEEFARFETGVRLTQAGLACAHYRALEGRWPTGLGAVAARTGIAPPPDPLTGEAFVLSEVDNLFYLSSPGLDPASDADDLGFVIAVTSQFQ